MPYTVEITTPPVQVNGETRAARMYQLPDPFSTLSEARDAAMAHIADVGADLGLDPAEILYTVFDREGFTVASNADLPAGVG